MGGGGKVLTGAEVPKRRARDIMIYDWTMDASAAFSTVHYSTAKSNRIQISFYQGRFFPCFLDPGWPFFLLCSFLDLHVVPFFVHS